MRSAFPGMDPYLERYWGDLRGSLVTTAKMSLNGAIGYGLVARAGVRTYSDDDDARRRALQPRATVPAAGGSPRTAALRPRLEPGDGSTAIASDPIRDSSVQILHAADGNRVIAVIEFLAPSNKTDKAARESYRAEPNECLEARTSLVGVDLTRAGHRRPLIDMNGIPAERRGG